MRLLIISNFYPPARPGGYTQWCHEVSQRLEACGNEIGVLTSRYELEKAPTDEKNIFRLLHLQGDLHYYQPMHFFTRWQQEQRENIANCRQVINMFEPDIVFVWGMWAMSKAVAAIAEKLMPGRVVYFLSDYWPAKTDMHTAYWQKTPRRNLRSLPKRLLRKSALTILNKQEPQELKFEHVICVSAAVKEILLEAGIPVEQARVIHGGSDVTRFFPVEKKGLGDRDKLQLLYAGQLAEHKGVHTALAAVSQLARRQTPPPIHLTLVGTGHPSYEQKLRDYVSENEIGQFVTFYGQVNPEEMPRILQQYDVLIFPSIYQEPLARMTQEAMATGLVVVGTTTGGTKEILIDGQNGLTFAPNDSTRLASHLDTIATDPELRYRLSKAARQTVVEKFTLERMVTEIENYLQEVVEDAHSFSHQLLPAI